MGYDAALTDVLTVGVELDLARRDHPVEHLRVVRADFRLRGPLLKASLGPTLLELATAEECRGDAVEGGGLMQPNEGIRLEPVPSRTVPAVDEGHPRVAVGDQRVGESHPRRAGAKHQVVHVEGPRHHVTIARTAAGGPPSG